jgi:hypothetical protein
MRPIFTLRLATVVIGIASVMLWGAIGSDAVPGAVICTRAEAQISKDNAPNGSGISGQVDIRPIRPHATIGVPNVTPYQAMVDVLEPNGHLLTTFKSETDGSFRVTLPPGTYILRPQSPGYYPRASEQTIVVKPNSFTQVNIVYDTGIR